VKRCNDNEFYGKYRKCDWMLTTACCLVVGLGLALGLGLDLVFGWIVVTHTDSYNFPSSQSLSSFLLALVSLMDRPFVENGEVDPLRGRGQPTPVRLVLTGGARSAAAAAAHSTITRRLFAAAGGGIERGCVSRFGRQRQLVVTPTRRPTFSAPRPARRPADRRRKHATRRHINKRRPTGDTFRSFGSAVCETSGHLQCRYRALFCSPSMTAKSRINTRA